MLNPVSLVSGGSSYSVEESSYSDLKVPPNTPTLQAIQQLSARTIPFPTFSSTASLESHHDKEVPVGQRHHELECEVLEEALKKGENLTEEEVEEKISKKIDAPRWVTKKLYP